MEFTFLDECGDPYISCCKAAKELEQLRTEITRLTTALAAAEKDICKLIDGTCPNIDALEKNFQHSQSELGKTIARAEKAEKRAEAAEKENANSMLPCEYSGTIQHLKTVQPYYDASASGVKTFEIRKNDRVRRYAVGDILHLYEWTGVKETGRSHYKQVTYILEDAPYVPEDYVCMAVWAVSKEAVKEAREEWRGEGEA